MPAIQSASRRGDYASLCLWRAKAEADHKDSQKNGQKLHEPTPNIRNGGYG